MGSCFTIIDYSASSLRTLSSTEIYSEQADAVSDLRRIIKGIYYGLTEPEINRFLLCIGVLKKDSLNKMSLPCVFAHPLPSNPSPHQMWCRPRG